MTIWKKLNKNIVGTLSYVMISPANFIKEEYDALLWWCNCIIIMQIKDSDICLWITCSYWLKSVPNAERNRLNLITQNVSCTVEEGQQPTVV